MGSSRAQSASASRWLIAFVRLAMRKVNFAIVRVFGSQIRVVDDRQVFRITFFRLLREIEGAGKNGPAVDDYYLVVRSHGGRR